MDKIFLILKREYLTRVRKKSFLITTFVFPILMGSIWILPAWLSTQPAGERTIEVIDRSGIFKNHFNTKENIKFVESNLPLEVAKNQFIDEGYSGLLYIPKFNIESPKGFTFWSAQTEGLELQANIEKILENEIERLRLQKAGIDKEVLEKNRVSISLETKSFDGEQEKESNTGIATALSIIFAFIIYFAIFMYGAQVMRGVVDEKTNRIVEIIISSVRPFQLMMGKILGIAAVAFTQLLLWVILTISVAIAVAKTIDIKQGKEIVAENQNVDEMVSADKTTLIVKTFNSFSSINLPFILGMFAIYFIGGYLLYSALFAAVGSAVDSDTDTQQFMLPITIPLALSFAMISVILKDPHSSMAVWLSIIPITSPVIMTMRLPFDVPVWQLFASISLLIGGFVFTTWFAGRIYRVGILMYGKKVNYRELMKWFFIRN
jgi:ABC-2 type transport system permease protein